MKAKRAPGERTRVGDREVGRGTVGERAALGCGAACAERDGGDPPQPCGALPDGERDERGEPRARERAHAPAGASQARARDCGRKCGEGEPQAAAKGGMTLGEFDCDVGGDAAEAGPEHLREPRRPARRASSLRRGSERRREGEQAERRDDRAEERARVRTAGAMLRAEARRVDEEPGEHGEHHGDERSAKGHWRRRPFATGAAAPAGGPRGRPRQPRASLPERPMIVDFHSHTLASDGTLEPQALAGLMRARGVEIFAITDHDSLGAYGHFDPGPAELVVGIELNTTYRGNEVHVLGFGFLKGDERFVAAIAANRASRVERAKRMAAQLSAAGYQVTYDEIRAEAGGTETSIGRPHVARALIRKGYVATIEAAFREALASGKPGYVPSSHMTPQEAIALVLCAGGVPVLAHPGRLKDETIIEELVTAGLLGLEVFYPTHDRNQVAHFRALAARFGLVMTAGSDFHDKRYNPRGVGMDVAREDLSDFLDLVR